MDPIVSVIVVTKNEERYISNCIESILSQNFPIDNYEIIVVDGGSTDKTQQIVKNHNVKLIIDKDGSIAHGRNIGVKNSKGMYVAFTDGDCVVEKSWLKKLIYEIKKSSNDVVAVGGPNLVFDDDSLFAKSVGYMQETYLGSGGSPQSYRINKPKYVQSIPNCNIMYKNEIISSERYDNSFSMGDDCEFNFRLKQKGYKFLYIPDILVWHHRRDSIKTLSKKMFLYAKSMARITKKHKKIVRWYSIIPPLVILAIILAFPLIYYFPVIKFFYICMVLIYFFLSIISTIHVYKKSKSLKSIVTLLLLPLQHIMYGLGFYMGIFQRRGHI